MRKPGKPAHNYNDILKRHVGSETEEIKIAMQDTTNVEGHRDSRNSLDICKNARVQHSRFVHSDDPTVSRGAVTWRSIQLFAHN